MWNNGQEIDLLEMIGKALFILRRTWFICFLVLIIGVGASGAYVNHTYVPTYETKATFAVSREMNGEKSFQYNKEATDELAVSFSSIITSDVMKDAMSNDLGMEYLPATISAKRIGTTNLFTVVSSGRDAEMVRAVMQAFLDNYARVFRVTLMDINLEMIEEPGEKAYVANEPAYVSICGKVAILIIAVYVMVCVAYLLLRRTITEEEEVKQTLKTKCLGVMPYVKVTRKGRNPLISADLVVIHNI